MTTVEFLKLNKDKYEYRDDLISACAKAMGLKEKSVGRTYRSLWGNFRDLDASKKKQKKKKISTISGAEGVDDFRKLFSRAEVKKRRTEKSHKRIEEAIEGILKERVWIPDAEFRDIIGVSPAEWSNLRTDFEHLIIADVIDENRRKYTIWAHPERVDELRQIVNE